MTIVDHVIHAVEASDRIDDDKRQTLVNFFTANRELFETVGDGVTQTFVNALAQGDVDAAWQALTEKLSQEEVVRLLELTREQMADTARRAQAARAQFQALLDTVGAVAFRAALGVVL